MVTGYPGNPLNWLQSKSLNPSFKGVNKVTSSYLHRDLWRLDEWMKDSNMSLAERSHEKREISRNRRHSHPWRNTLNPRGQLSLIANSGHDAKVFIHSILMAYIDEFEHLPEEITVERIICLGLGSLVEGARRISETQLLLLLELRRLVNVPTNHLDYIDLGSGDSLRPCIYRIGYWISSIIGDYRAGLDPFRCYWLDFERAGLRL